MSRTIEEALRHALYCIMCVMRPAWSVGAFIGEVSQNTQNEAGSEEPVLRAGRKGRFVNKELSCLFFPLCCGGARGGAGRMGSECG